MNDTYPVIDDDVRLILTTDSVDAELSVRAHGTRHLRSDRLG